MHEKNKTAYFINLFFNENNFGPDNYYYKKIITEPFIKKIGVQRF